MDFLNKMSESINQKQEIGALQKDISSNQAVISNLYLEIGSKYYEQHKDETDSEFAQQFRVIRIAKRNIDLANEKIRIVKGVVACSNCGVDNPISENYCSKCGAKLVPPVHREEEKSTSEEKLSSEEKFSSEEKTSSEEKSSSEERVHLDEKITCEGCGSQIPLGSTFCQVCGRRLK